MYLEVFPAGPLSTNAILLACESTKKAICIDPSKGSQDFFCQRLQEKFFEPVAIVLTHSHWDHIADVADLKKKLQIPVYVHELDAQNLLEPGSDHLPMMFSIEGVRADTYLQDQQILQVGDLSIKILHTPGHSPGCVCLYLEREKTLISGDTIFRGSIGNVSFPMSEPTKMWQSCKILSQLPSDTRVIPGHGPETTIGRETWLKDAKKYFSSG